MSNTSARPPAAAGLFYPSNPIELSRQLSGLLDKACNKRVSGKITGIISPHAGYEYSGLTAAHAYSTLRGEMFDVVVVVSPSHRELFPGISVYSGHAYSTPLGIVEVDTVLRKELADACDLVEVSEKGHMGEHALEVQLPFLQKVLPSFLLLPVMMGNQQPETCFRLGDALGKILKNKNALLVASTDLSHYHTVNEAEEFDNVVMRDLRDFDYRLLMNDLELHRAEACGGGPTVSVLSALDQLGVRNIDILHYANSGDTTGDYSVVVGYLSAIAYS